MHKRLVETFQVRSEKDQKVYTAHHREHYVDVTNQESDGQETLDTGVAEYNLGDGRRLRMADESGDRFEIVETREFVRRISWQ